MKRAKCQVNGVDHYQLRQRHIRTFWLVVSELVKIYDSPRIPVEGRTIVGGFGLFDCSFHSFRTGRW